MMECFSTVLLYLTSLTAPVHSRHGQDAKVLINIASISFTKKTVILTSQQLLCNTSL